jgi:hypothetical protein
VIAKPDWQRLETAEQAEALRLGMEAFKYDSNDQMLAVVGVAQPAWLDRSITHCCRRSCSGGSFK